MKTWVVAAIVVLPCVAQTARDYYTELYAAGGLSQMLADRVCFDERLELETFFIFTESKVIREVMIADGSFARAPKGFQDKLKKEALIARGYDKGVSLGSDDEFFPDNGTWLSAKFMIGKSPARLRLLITPETFRYKRSVEVLNADGTLQGSVSTYGRCEYVAPDIKQHGQ